MRFLREVYIRWVGIALLAVIIDTVIMADHMANEPYLYRYLICWCFTAVYWNGAYAVFVLFRRVYPEIKNTVKRLIFTYIVLIIWMTVGGVPVKLIFGFLDIEGLLDWTGFVDKLMMNLVIAFIVATVYETVFFFEQWKFAIRQNELLKNSQIRTQFEVLQNQMSPHFLFNSLNTLTTLIAENQETAINFTQKLSDVYRYILQNKEKGLVPLTDEMAFAKDYVFLLKMRYPDNFDAEFNLNGEWQQKQIAPLTLQMLIENSIKHNVVSRSNPLLVEIYSESGRSIVISNKVNLKNTLEKTTKTGLNNITKRYEYLTDREVEIIDKHENFTVSVPLLDVVAERSETQTT